MRHVAEPGTLRVHLHSRAGVSRRPQPCGAPQGPLLAACPGALPPALSDRTCKRPCSTSAWILLSPFVREWTDQEDQDREEVADAEGMYIIFGEPSPTWPPGRVKEWLRSIINQACKIIVCRLPRSTHRKCACLASLFVLSQHTCIHAAIAVLCVSKVQTSNRCRTGGRLSQCHVRTACPLPRQGRSWIAP